MLHGYRQCHSLHKKRVDIAKDVETRFDTSNYELEISFLEEKQVIGLMKDELDANLMTEFATLKPKTYSYLIDNDDENKNGKDKKKVRH